VDHLEESALSLSVEREAFKLDYMLMWRREESL
jgi:hypothetical protein